jgi:peptide-methionine (S)-S-oxide reductase
MKLNYGTQNPGRWLTAFSLAVLLGAGTAMTDETQTTANPSQELATFGGGCFWCTEAVFEQLDGVKSVTSGYAGGATENPTYQQVCSGLTGHAEVIQIEFDPGKITYDRLLEVFWLAHDPTTLNRQGADSGTQYRSIILYHSEDQKLVAKKSMIRAQANFYNPIVTQLEAFTKLYPAEQYHQDFYRRNPNQGYCRMVISPKLKKLQKELQKP